MLGQQPFGPFFWVARILSGSSSSRSGRFVFCSLGGRLVTALTAISVTGVTAAVLHFKATFLEPRSTRSPTKSLESISILFTGCRLYFDQIVCICGLCVRDMDVRSFIRSTGMPACLTISFKMLQDTSSSCSSSSSSYSLELGGVRARPCKNPLRNPLPK